MTGAGLLRITLLLAQGLLETQLEGEVRTTVKDEKYERGDLARTLYSSSLAVYVVAAWFAIACIS